VVSGVVVGVTAMDSSDRPRAAGRVVRSFPLRTVDVARAVDVHPNTVRLYEANGYLPPVPRSPTGYRWFTGRHLDHLRLARFLLLNRWPGRTIRRSAQSVLVNAALRGLPDSLTDIESHLELIRAEQVAADEAREVVRRWLLGSSIEVGGRPGDARPGEVVRRLGLTHDTLRSWERSGLIQVRRDEASGERRYSPSDIDRLVVIRALRWAGYSPMAVLRMLAAADAGRSAHAIAVLTEPDGEEDLVTAGDRWAATLAEHERAAVQAVALVRRVRAAAYGASPPH
jgi:DNA-binding transcriptional MerR regulator